MHSDPERQSLAADVRQPTLAASISDLGSGPIADDQGTEMDTLRQSEVYGTHFSERADGPAEEVQAAVVDPKDLHIEVLEALLVEASNTRTEKTCAAVDAQVGRNKINSRFLWGGSGVIAGVLVMTTVLIPVALTAQNNVLRRLAACKADSAQASMTTLPSPPSDSGTVVTQYPTPRCSPEGLTAIRS